MLPARSRKNTAAASVEATAAPSRKHLHPVERRHVVGAGAEDQRRQRDADRGQRERRPCRLPQHGDRRAEAGVEQDDGQRQRADEIGELDVVELDAQAVGAAKPARSPGTEARAARRSGRRSGSRTPRRAPARWPPASRDRLSDPFRPSPKQAACFLPRHRVRRRQGGGKRSRRRPVILPAIGRAVRKTPGVRPGVAGRCVGRGRQPIVLPNATAVSAMRFEKPHSLSYQDSTETKSPSITLVWSSATVDECGSWLKSIDTFG